MSTPTTVRVPSRLASLLARLPGFEAGPIAAPRKRIVHNYGSRTHKAAEINRFGAGWISTPETAMQVIVRDQRILRARARERTQNDDYVRRFLAMLDANVIGEDGIAVYASTRDPERNGELDKDANTAIDDAFEDWSLNHCDIEGSLTWPEIQSLWLRTVAVDGEVLIKKIRGPQVVALGNPYGYALQVLDPELLPVDMARDLGGGNYILGGIEFDGNNRPLAYHIRTTAPTATSFSWYTRPTERIPANEIAIAFIKERPGQRRGLTWLCSGLLRMRMLETYEDAALIAARIGASKMGFIYNDPQHPNPQDYIADTDADGNVVTDVEAGSIEELPDGKLFTGFDPGYPRGDFEPFVKAILRGIGAGLNVSYPTFGNDLEGVNYSSIRQGVLDNRDAWRKLQKWTTNRLCRPTFDDWLIMSVLYGAISVNGTSLRPDRFEKYRRVRFQGRRWAWVDPLKDINANVIAIQNRLTTRSRVIREQQGLDPNEIFEEAEAEEKLLASKGLTVIASASAPVTVELKEKNPDDEED